MLNQVLFDLRVFLLFYFILLIIFSFIFAVLGVGNKHFGTYKEYYGEMTLEEGIYSEVEPMLEYHHIGLLLGYIITSLRMSLSDFDFAPSIYLSKEENILYWIMWFLVVLLTCIVFLNFIIAEASNSYSNVMDRLEALKNKEKSCLISEAEDIMFDSSKDDKKLPKYIIVRSIET